MPIRVIRIWILGWLATTLASPVFVYAEPPSLKAKWASPVSGEVPGRPLLKDLTGDGTLDLIWADATTSVRRLHALDGLTGRPLWQRTLRDGQLDQPLLLDIEGVDAVVLRGDFGGPIAVRAADGELLWDAKARNRLHFGEGSLDALTTIADVTGDRVADIVATWQVFRGDPLSCPLYGDAEARLVILSGRSGQIVQEHRMSGGDALARFTAQSISDGLIVFRASGSCQVERAPRLERWLHAGNALRRTWVEPVGGIVHVVEHEAITYIAGESGTVRALRAGDGALVWRQTWPGLAFVAPPAPVAWNGKHLLLLSANDATSDGAVVLAIEAATGREVFRAARPGQIFWEAPPRIVHAADGWWLQFVTHDRDGQVLPADATLYAINLDTGHEVRLERKGTSAAGVFVADLDQNGYMDVLFLHSDNIERLEYESPTPDSFAFR